MIKLLTSAVDLSSFSVWDSRTTRTEIYPGKTVGRTGTGNEPDGMETKQFSVSVKDKTGN